MTQPLEGQPVGPEYGLAVRTPADHLQILPPVTSEVILPTDATAYKDGSEFGGVGGLVQPAPHVPTAHERMMQMYAIDPSDPGTEVGSVVAPELEGDFR